MTNDARIKQLRSAGLKVSYVSREDAQDGSLPPYDHYFRSNPEDGMEAYVSLSRIANGEDAYGQVSTVDRSNFRSLQRDYPDVWTVVSYVNVDALGAFVADLDEDLTEVLVKLATEYPVYDEDDMSTLEDSEISEQWDDYAASDFRDELPEDLRDQWDELADDRQRELFQAACDEAGYYPEHNGVEVLWSYAFEKTSAIVADRLR